jgi:hypothetical protein
MSASPKAPIRIKARSSPAAFSTPFLSLIPFSCTAIVPQAKASSTFPLPRPVPHRRIRCDQLEKCLGATAGSYSLVPRQHCLFYHYGRGSALNNDADGVPGFPGPRRPVHATALDAGLLLSSALGNESHPISHVSTVVDKYRVRVLTSYLTDTSSSANLHHGLVG